MNGVLDNFVLWLAEIGINKWMVIAYIPLFAFTIIMFPYYWYKAVRAWFTGAKASGGRKNWRAHLGCFLGFDVQNPDLRRFYSYWVKGIAVWFIAGWPLLLVASGLLSEEAANIFLGQSAEISD